MNAWNPTRFERWEDCNDRCSTGVARIQTDSGPAYLKALGNAEGPHALVREWVGTSLARWFGLTTFDFARIGLEPGFDIKLGREKTAEPGPAFVTRAEPGLPWSGKIEEFKHVVNPGELTGLIILDTWLLNADRFPPGDGERHPNYDNVFLSTEGLSGKERRLVAMDFTECLKPPSTLTTRIADIGNWQEKRLFCFFPEFRDLIQRASYEQGLARLSEATQAEMEPIVQQLPREWDVSNPVRDAITRLLVQRAAFLVEHLPKALGPYVQEQMWINDTK